MRHVGPDRPQEDRTCDLTAIGAPSDHYIIRISTHLWTNASDIDRLIDAMWDLSRKMG
jgi:selenocysteine lyase/cysteine desulfurase